MGPKCMMELKPKSFASNSKKVKRWVYYQKSKKETSDGLSPNNYTQKTKTSKKMSEVDTSAAKFGHKVEKCATLKESVTDRNLVLVDLNNHCGTTSVSKKSKQKRKREKRKLKILQRKRKDADHQLQSERVSIYMKSHPDKVDKKAQTHLKASNDKRSSKGLEQTSGMKERKHGGGKAVKCITMGTKGQSSDHGFTPGKLLKKTQSDKDMDSMQSKNNRLSPDSNSGATGNAHKKGHKHKAQKRKMVEDRDGGTQHQKSAKVSRLDAEGNKMLIESEKMRSLEDQEEIGSRVEKKQKRKPASKRANKGNKILDSGMSSGTETPVLPKEPGDVAANWKALISKLKITGNSKNEHRTKKDKDKLGNNTDGEMWFDDVDPALMETEAVSSGVGAICGGKGRDEPGSGVKSNQVTNCVALDCEMVGIGHEGKDSILARVSMVNEYGQCIYDKFVKPREKVTDYRTAVSGVRPSDLYRESAEEFLTVQKEVSAIMKGRILVGHALRNDMKVLFLGHPRRLVRDTALYPHFRELMKTKRPALRKLAKAVLGVTIQEGEHSSVEDARTAMRLYTLHRTSWEKLVKHNNRSTQIKK